MKNIFLPVNMPGYRLARNMQTIRNIIRRITVAQHNQHFKLPPILSLFWKRRNWGYTLP